MDSRNSNMAQTLYWLKIFFIDINIFSLRENTKRLYKHKCILYSVLHACFLWTLFTSFKKLQTNKQTNRTDTKLYKLVLKRLAPVPNHLPVPQNLNSIPVFQVHVSILLHVMAVLKENLNFGVFSPKATTLLLQYSFTHWFVFLHVHALWTWGEASGKTEELFFI